MVNLFNRQYGGGFGDKQYQSGDGNIYVTGTNFDLSRYTNFATIKYSSNRDVFVSGVTHYDSGDKPTVFLINTVTTAKSYRVPSIMVQLTVMIFLVTLTVTLL